MKKHIVTLVLCLTSALTSVSVLSAPYHGREMIFRMGLSNAVPDESPSSVTWNGRPSNMTLNAGEDTQASLSFQYFIDRNWALEVMSALPFEHDITYQGYLNDEGESSLLGSAKQVTTTFNSLYYLDRSWFIKPYAGFGFSYTFFYGEKITSINQNFFSGLKVGDTFALNGQLGLDIQLSKSWSLNTSARFYDLETSTTFALGQSGRGTRVKSRMSLDPTVYSVMIGYKF